LRRETRFIDEEQCCGGNEKDHSFCETIATHGDFLPNMVSQSGPNRRRETAFSAMYNQQKIVSAVPIQIDDL
jgi:hypothetical protein